MENSNKLAPVRRNILRQWMLENELNHTGLALKLDVGRAYVSLLFKEGRYFGEKAARTIETKLHLPQGFLDDLSDVMQPVKQWDSPADLPDRIYAQIPRTSIKISASGEVESVMDQSLPELALSKELLLRRQVSHRAKLRMIVVRGDAMENYIGDGDLVVVDMAQNEVVDNEVFAVRFVDEIRIRRLAKRFDGGLTVRSDNPRYPAESLMAADAQYVQVLGRCVWRGG